MTYSLFGRIYRVAMHSSYLCQNRISLSKWINSLYGIVYRDASLSKRLLTAKGIKFEIYRTILKCLN